MNTIDKFRLTTIITLHKLGEEFRKETGQHPSMILDMGLTEWLNQIQGCFLDEDLRPLPEPSLTTKAMSFEDCIANIERLRLDTDIQVTYRPEEMPERIKSTMNWLMY